VNALRRGTAITPRYDVLNRMIAAPINRDRLNLEIEDEVQGK
jgi:hypothetical protein